MNYFRRKLDFKIIKHDSKDLKDFNFIKKIIEKEFIEIISNKVFPSDIMFRKKKLYNISRAIIKYHGGLANFAQKMGCSIFKNFFKTSDGHIVASSNEYEFDEFLYSRGIEHDYGKKITSELNYKYDFFLKEKNYYVEIWGFDEKSAGVYVGYHKTKSIKKELYKKLSLNLLEIEGCKFLAPIKNVENYLSNLVENIGYKQNINNIKHNVDTCRFYNMGLVEKELDKLIKNLGRFPSSSEVIEYGCYSLKNAIYRFGGINFWRRKLKYPEITTWLRKNILK